MKDNGKKGKESAHVGIAVEVTGEAIAQHTDKHARNVVVEIIFLKFVYKEIRVRGTRRRTW